MRLSSLVVAAAALVALGAVAQEFPSRPLKIVVGFAPSGGTDITARIIAKKLAEQTKQQVLVENRPGGGGVLATELIATAPPDGYTLLLGAVGPFAVNPHMQKVRYDVARDLAPVTMAVTFPNVLVVHPSVKATSLAEYVALARDPANRLAYGTSGIGGAGHLAGELLNGVAKIDVPHVAYKGGGPAMSDLLASLPSALPQIQAGKIRALATTGRTRARDLPQVPIVAESYPGYEATNWYAFVVPAKTPRPIIDRLVADIGAVLRASDVLEQLGSHGMEAQPGTPEALAAFMRREYETWGKVVRAAGIKPE
jgi:tripartite-type tricarboxylate transporter receptor subunit TctC